MTVFSFTKSSKIKYLMPFFIFNWQFRNRIIILWLAGWLAGWLAQRNV